MISFLLRKTLTLKFFILFILNISLVSFSCIGKTFKSERWLGEGLYSLNILKSGEKPRIPRTPGEEKPKKPENPCEECDKNCLECKQREDGLFVCDKERPKPDDNKFCKDYSCRCINENKHFGCFQYGFVCSNCQTGYWVNLEDGKCTCNFKLVLKKRDGDKKYCGTDDDCKRDNPIEGKCRETLKDLPQNFFKLPGKFFIGFFYEKKDAKGNIVKKQYYNSEGKPVVSINTLDDIDGKTELYLYADYQDMQTEVEFDKDWCSNETTNKILDKDRAVEKCFSNFSAYTDKDNFLKKCEEIEYKKKCEECFINNNCYYEQHGYTDKNGKKCSPGLEGIVVKYGEGKEVSSKPERIGYDFIGYSENANLKENNNYICNDKAEDLWFNSHKKKWNINKNKITLYPCFIAKERDCGRGYYLSKDTGGCTSCPKDYYCPKEETLKYKPTKDVGLYSCDNNDEKEYDKIDDKKEKEYITERKRSYFRRDCFPKECGGGHFLNPHTKYNERQKCTKCPEGFKCPGFKNNQFNKKNGIYLCREGTYLAESNLYEESEFMKDKVCRKCSELYIKDYPDSPDNKDILTDLFFKSEKYVLGDNNFKPNNSHSNPEEAKKSCFISGGKVTKNNNAILKIHDKCRYEPPPQQ